MINRNIAPQQREISKLDFILPEQWKLNNGVKVWGINAGSQELVKIDFIFDAGAWYQPQNLIAGLTNAFMNQGSKHYSAQQIAQLFDSRGAYLQLVADQQYGCVTILTLNKYIDEILEVTADVIQNPIFPEHEIAAQIGKKKQQFTIENNKVKTLTQKKFSQVLFGEKHPYSNTNKLSDYDLLSSDKLKEYHGLNYGSESCKIIVAGQYGSKLKDILNQYFGNSNWTSLSKTDSYFDIKGDIQKVHFVEKSDALQSAIRIGRLVPNRDEADFHGLTILVTLLGGYFGSRLMANIREDNGYTYGIGAGIYSMPNAAYLTISTEVGCDVTKAALKEIYFEIERLQTELVGEDELSVVRNYLLGENLRSFDGVFAMASSLRVLLEAGLG
ncbi:MAG: pitrilysin family protein, partial [Prolixibacteraceae bacterium]|nr:pitrilysin family protein [Prolixibacteraceae bacterium]